MKYRPGWLTAFTVIAIVLGVLGCVSALFATVGLLMAEQFQEMVVQMQQAGPNKGQANLIQEMNSKMLEVADRWQNVNIVLIALHFLLSAALFVGGIQVLRLRPSGRKFLSTLFAVAVVFEIVRLVPQIMIQMETMPISREYMGKMPGMSSAMQSSMMSIGIIYLTLWLVIKLSYYISGFIYLRRPAILSLYGEQPNGIANDSVETVDPV